MEILFDLFDRTYCDITGEKPIKPILHSLEFGIVNVNVCVLPKGVNTGIGSSSACDGNSSARQPFECCLYLPLDRSLIRLGLPPGEVGAVVLDG